MLFTAFANEYVPTKESENALCYDLRCSESVMITPGEIKLVPTGVKVNGHCYVYNRSSNPLKKGLVLANGVGVIDADYRGEIMVMLWNITKENVVVSTNDRIAQLEPKDGHMEEYPNGYVDWQNLFPTDRWAGGFGSTGI